MSFVLDPRIAASTHPLAQLPLCEARLQDDARFPWIVLIPRHEGAVEVADLSHEDRARLFEETLRVGAAVRAVAEMRGWPHVKLNHGQLGNVVSQLHMHVVGRRQGDAAWPGPVWGFGAAEPYGADALAQALAAGRAALA
jgi:diadenosine tetraphosphate (Ap4A) HIT family hydrolase